MLPNGDLTNFDGWGHQFDLKYEGDLLTLTSYGADGRAGGDDDDMDLTATMRVTGRNVQWVKPPAGCSIAELPRR
ncbi:MAG: type II secretion system protein GspG [Planctomycetaceae bacterium]